MIRRTALVLCLCLCGAARAGGDDAPKPAPAATSDAPSGFKANLKLTNGRSLSGVIRAEGTWERRDDKGAWVSCAKEDAGACVRLWYVSGGEGFVVVTAKTTESVENLGAVDAADLKKIAGDAEAAGKRADAERDQLRKEREAARAAAEKAAAAKPKPLTADELAKQAAQAAADKRAAELLAKFPPKDWSADRRDEIQRRALIMKIMPTKDEREFLDNFATWAKAAAAAAEKDVADKKETEKKEADKKDAAKKDDGKKDDAPPAGGK